MFCRGQLVVIVIAMLSLTFTFAQADVITIESDKATFGYDDDSDPNVQHTNYGSDEYLFSAGYWGSNHTSRIFIEFDLSSIPTGATINAASLKLQRARWSGPVLTIMRVTENWDEDTLTYANRPGGSGSYGSYDTSDQAIYPEWNDAALAGLVQDWVDGTVPNYGIMFEHSGDSGNVRFYSDDTTTGMKPQLTVDYIPEPATLSLLGIGGLWALIRRR